MAEIRIIPTRMELKKLQTRYNTVRRGHRLLKDKCDELMRCFLEVAREDKEVRAQVEKALGAAFSGFAVAGATSNPRMMEEALILPRSEGKLEAELKNHTGVMVPEFHLEMKGNGDSANYGYAFTSGELDVSVKAFGDILPQLVRMAQLEKEAELLAGEIERTRRRVNALEHIMMPRYLEAIHSIRMKLDENERGNISRLMKVKDMMVKASLEQKHSYFSDEEEPQN